MEFLLDMKQQGVIGTDDVEIKSIGGLRGLYTRKPLDAGQVVLTIPKELIIGWNKSRDLQIRDISRAIGLPNYRTYFDLILPSESELNQHPILKYTQEEVKLLTSYGRSVWNILNTEVNSLRETFSLPELKFRMAQSWYIYVTRSHENGLVPIVDFCNHSDTPNCVVKFDENSVKLITTSNIDGNSELRCSYGFKGVTDLYLIYMIPPTEVNHVTIKRGISDNPLGSSFHRFIKNVLGSNKKYFEYIVLPNGPESNTLKFSRAVAWTVIHEKNLPKKYTGDEDDSNVKDAVTTDLYSLSDILANIEMYRDGPPISDPNHPLAPVRQKEENILSACTNNIFIRWNQWVANCTKREVEAMKSFQTEQALNS